jgi:hypothetical protein
MLRANDGNINKAAPRLARELMRDVNRPLLIQLIADYLARLPAAEVVRSQGPGHPVDPISRRHQNRWLLHSR